MGKIPFSVLIIIAIHLVSENESRQRNENQDFKQLDSICGVRKNRSEKEKSASIVGGNEAGLNAWPWAAALGRYEVGDTFTLICGGNLINKRYVLSAAHCCPSLEASKDFVRVLLGQHSLSRKTDDAIALRMEDLVCHEKFNADTNDNDIAIVRLEKDVTFTDAIRPICLPPPEEEFLQGFDEKTMTVVGWGRITEEGPVSDVLQEVDVYGFNIKVCVDAYQYLVVITDNRICAGVRGGGKDACQGDSGGPLMYMTEKSSGPVFYLVGIVSAGFGCARPNFYGLYTRVTDQIQWILKNVSD